MLLGRGGLPDLDLKKDKGWSPEWQDKMYMVGKRGEWITNDDDWWWKYASPLN